MLVSLLILRISDDPDVEHLFGKGTHEDICEGYGRERRMTGVSLWCRRDKSRIDPQQSVKQVRPNIEKCLLNSSGSVQSPSSIARIMVDVLGIVA
jgi:hypothetical protein